MNPSLPASNLSAAPQAPVVSGSRRRVWALLAAACLLGEAWLFTWGRLSLGDYLSGVVLTLCGLVAVGATYLAMRGRRWLLPAAQNSALLVRKSYGGWGIALAAGLGVVACTVRQQEVIQEFILSIGNSDIIPALSIYPRRLLAGEAVYAPFTEELGYFALPTYLPATWGPYLLPQVLEFDYRWMAFGLLLLGVGCYLVLVYRLRLSVLASFTLALLPFALTLSVQHTEAPMFGQTVEEMIIGYYFVLLSGLLLRQRALLILGLLLCLLSRYSLVLWVPLLLGLLYWQQGWREAVLVTGAVGLGVVVLYILPFLSHDWTLFLRVQQSYAVVAAGEWQHLNERGLPFHLYNGVGLGNLLYQFGSGSIPDKISLLRKLHLAGLLGTVLGAALLYWREAASRTDYRVFCALALKFYLVMFYALLQVPYAYLASVSVFASCFLAVLLVQAVQPEARAVSSAAA